jgi:hypothetical protein
MGLSVYPYLVLGAPLHPGELQVVTPAMVDVCPNGHPYVPGSGPFCSTCGSKLHRGEKKEFKKALVDLATKWGRLPQVIFNEWFSNDDPDQLNHLQFHKVNPVVSSEDTRDHQFVLGYRLAMFECIEPRIKDPVSVRFDYLKQLQDQLFVVMCELDFVTRGSDIRLYLCTHVSC